MSERRLILAGFGGQGVLLIGQMISYAAMFEDKKVTFLPSYGPEMRGGTANCTVVVSDEMICCPLVESMDTLVAMNLPSLTKFEDMVEPGGTIFINSSLIECEPTRKDVTVYKVDASGIAEDLGNIKVANMVMLGAIVNKTKVVTIDAIEKVMEKKVFTDRKAKLLPLNKTALMAWKE